MTEIVRYTGNLQAPAVNAAVNKRGTFGDPSGPVSDTLDDNLNPVLLTGWEQVGPSEAPTIQDFNSMGFTLGQLHAYLHQKGIPEWDVSQEFYAGSVTSRIGAVYQATATSTGTDPATDATGEWILIGGSTLTEITASDAAWVGNQHAKARTFVSIGGGGGGGGVDGQGASTAAVGGAGAAGATSIRSESRKDFDTTYNIQIGAGGTGASATDGTNGGTTSVTSAGFTLTCTGGDGGVSMVASATIQRGIATQGGEASGGDINMGGDDALPAVVNGGRGIVHPSGPAAYLGSVTSRTFVNAASSAGRASRGLGGGGTGAVCDGVTTDEAGGDGGDGVVYVWEYF